MSRNTGYLNQVGQSCLGTQNGETVKYFTMAVFAILMLVLVAGCSTTPPVFEVVSTKDTCQMDLPKRWDQDPQIEHWQKAAYPEMAKRAEISGTVVVIVILDARGSVLNAQVSHSVNPLLDKASVEAAYQCRFSPAQKAGKTVASKIKVPFSFRIHN